MLLPLLLNQLLLLLLPLLQSLLLQKLHQYQSIANKLLGESNQWQGTVNDIMEKIQGNVPMIVVGGAALLVLLFIARR